MYERNRSGRKTEQMRKALIRYIIDHRLKQGDRLPSQAELVRIMGTSSSTVIRAVNSLHDDGILDVRNKVGVFLRNDHLAGKVARTVALLTQCSVANVSPYYAGLALMLINRLQAAGCQTLIYPWKMDQRQQEKLRSHREFPGLNDALVDGKIDAVFDFTGWDGDAYFEHFDVPLVTLGISPASRNSLVIDMQGFCRNAMEILAKKHVRRLRLISPHPLVSDLLCPLIREFGVFEGKEEEILLTIPHTREGRELARRSFAMAPDKRPEAFLFADEFVGADFLNGMVVCGAEQAGYQPLIVLGRDPELQVSYPRDNIILFEKRVHDIADMAVELILAVSRNHDLSLVRSYSYTPVGKERFFA